MSEDFEFGPFDRWVMRVVDLCCVDDPSAEMLLTEFVAVCSVVATRGEPRGVRQSLARLGYVVDDRDVIVSLRPKTLSDYPAAVTAENSRSQIAKAYLTHLFREAGE